MKKMTKEEFIKEYMNKSNYLKNIAKSIDMIGFFSNIYDEYLKMYDEGKVDDDKLLAMFEDKSNLLILNLDELLNSAYSNEDISDALKAEFNAYSWPMVSDPIETINDIYNELNNHIGKKAVLLAFPGFDDFVLLKEKYNPSNERMMNILNGMKYLDFHMINKKIKEYYEIIPEKKKEEKRELENSLSVIEKQKKLYDDTSNIINHESEYTHLLSENDANNMQIRDYNNLLVEKEKNRKLLEEQINRKREKYNIMNRGLNKFINKKEREQLSQSIDILTKNLEKINEEIKILQEKIAFLQKKIEENKASFFEKTSVTLEVYPKKLEEAKKAITKFEGYDSNKASEEIELLQTKISSIDTYLEEMQKELEGNKNASKHVS